MLRRCFLGIDVGATKTHALLVDETGQVIGFGQAGPGNHETVGYAGLAQALQTAAGQALAEAGLTAEAVAGAGFGLGGYDWPCERPEHLAAIASLGLGCPVELVNDTIIGLVAGSRRGWGVGVVSGTGCNCWGWDETHRTAHMTGAGEPMGEAAGAGELVGAAIMRVSRAWSCRGPATRLTEAFVELLGARDADDLIEGLTQERYRVGAGAARLVFRVAEAGDPVAQEAIAWAGEALADMACGVIRQLGFEGRAFEVVLVGSLFKGGPLLVEPMRRGIQALAPGAELVRLEAPPVVGAALLGLTQGGLNPQPLRLALTASTLRRLRG